MSSLFLKNFWSMGTRPEVARNPPVDGVTLPVLAEFRPMGRIPQQVPTTVPLVYHQLSIIGNIGTR
jgi:hypothetical protein